MQAGKRIQVYSCNVTQAIIFTDFSRELVKSNFPAFPSLADNNTPEIAWAVITLCALTLGFIPETEKVTDNECILYTHF